MSDIEKIKSSIDYDPVTGLFNRKKHGCDWYGGIKHNQGYFSLSINRKKYLAHRVAWLLMTGSWPNKQIDHINGVRSDNRFVNLREVSHSENQQNMKKSKSNTSGITGVCFDVRTKKWIAHIGINGKYVNLGRFNTIFEASEARSNASKTNGFHENHGRKLN